MSRTNLGLLSLCVVMFGVMAFTASAAQANEWLLLDINGSTLEARNLSAFLESSLENNDGALLFTILGVNVKLLCTTMALVGMKLEINGTLTNGSKARFTGCEIYLEGLLFEECEPHSAGSAVGTVITKPLKGELALHEGVIVAKVEPSTGALLVPIDMGNECPIGAEVPVEGRLFVKDCESKAGEFRVQHLIEEESVLTELTALGEPATLDGSALTFLTGAHAGLKWRADA